MSLRVDQTLLEEAQTVLAENETLSAFVESTLRAAIARRRSQRECVARGVLSAEEARRTGEYVDAAEVRIELGTMLKAARAAKITG
ncbi:YlcI/YnfO family protein [Burkholderia sp. SIMBA_062]|uniref:YlcI/YnfO family protein n=1 Tax=Burkholderia sp. SIMBA_062 TaxID=3085803 RepID=UPI0039794DF1